MLKISLLEQRSPKSDDPTFIPISALIGTLHLETTDLSENHDRYLAESIEQELSLENLS